MRVSLVMPFLSLALIAQDPVPVQAPIQSVKLYPSEGWVTRVGRVVLDSGGTRKLVVSGLPAGLSLDDVQVSLQGPADSRLGDVSVSQDARAVDETPDWKRLQADQEALQDKVDGLQSQSDAVKQEIAFLEGIQAAQGKDLGARMTSATPNLAPVIAFGQGLQDRLAKLMLQERKLKRDLEKATKEQKRLDAEKAKLSGQDRVAPAKVGLEVTTPNGGVVEVRLSTRTRAARWTPVYEARLSEDRTRLDLSLFASVVQQSGEDWRGVQMEISSAKPSQSLATPSFDGAQEVGWYLAPPPPAPPIEALASVPKGRDAQSVAFLAPGITGANSTENSYVLDGLNVPDRRAGFGEAVATLQESHGTSLTLRLDGRKEVPSDGEAHRFKLMDESVTPTLALVTAPRLDATVYQVARFQAPTSLPIFTGAQLVQYFGSQRLGQAPLMEPSTGQPYQLGFGPYRGLRVSFRVLDHKQETVGAFSKERQWTLRDRLEVTSDIRTPVEVEIQDRRLKSTIESVKVTDLPETTPGAKETVPGVWTWNLQVAPGQTTGVTEAIQVRGPLGGVVTGLDASQ